MKILQFPLTRIFFGVLFGILLFQIVPADASIVFTVLAVCLVSLSVTSFYSRNNSFNKIVFGLLVILTSLFIGLSTALVNKEKLNPYHYTHQIEDYEMGHTLNLLVTQKLKSTKKNNRYVCLVKALNGQRSFGKIMLNISKKKSRNTFKDWRLSSHNRYYLNK